MIAAVALIACVVLPATASAAPAVPFHKLRDPFFKYARPAAYKTVSTSGVHVPLRDGSYLVCTIARPATAGRPAPGRFPGVIIDYTPYSRFRLSYDPPTARFYASRGYNVAYCDPRGSGASPGALDPFSLQERQDNYDLVEWLARQPFSDGNIGQEGGSYGGDSTLLAAVAQPPHLRAILVYSGFSNWYLDSFYHGGIESVTQSAWERSLVNGDVGRVTLLDNLFATYREHPLYDSFWRQRSVSDQWDKLTMPTLEIEGWYDRYKRGMIANYQARKQNVWLVLGPWSHYTTVAGTPAHPFPQGSLGRQPNLAWWDRWLKGKQRARLPRRRVTAFELPDRDGTGWHQFRDWPPPGARKVRFFFNSDNTLATTAGAAAQRTYTDNGRDSGCDPSSASECDHHQAAYDKSHRRLIYTTTPLGSDIVISGATNAVIRAAFPSGDGNVVVRLSDVAPDGSVKQLATGWRRAALYRGYDHLETLEPGAFYDVPVDVYDDYYRVAKRHRLRLSVSSGDYPDATPDANDGKLITVATGRDGSFADLTLVAAAKPRRSGMRTGSSWRRLPQASKAAAGGRRARSPTVQPHRP